MFGASLASLVLARLTSVVVESVVALALDQEAAIVAR